MHLVELRSGREGHPAYRAVAHQMHALIAERHPAVAAAMTHVDDVGGAAPRADPVRDAPAVAPRRARRLSRTDGAGRLPTRWRPSARLRTARAAALRRYARQGGSAQSARSRPRGPAPLPSSRRSARRPRRRRRRRRRARSARRAARAGRRPPRACGRAAARAAAASCPAVAGRPIRRSAASSSATARSSAATGPWLRRRQRSATHAAERGQQRDRRARTTTTPGRRRPRPPPPAPPGPDCGPSRSGRTPPVRGAEPPSPVAASPRSELSSGGRSIAAICERAGVPAASGRT